nr:UDP-N-acetylglucosamine acyltransferase [Kibdelosporangium sp. MJ126-NF4]CEL16217.1 Acyl-[acyl-carrier-protein]--UDP-N-acetylglucosamine O-acyltransferase [Kibdelosporangium sp. MJ126-NF4]CTQ94142.1 Acyl-[acyl-carrier-protein]--UDP-N-acetylglucosamine O-acyltransferase (EC 2.3.1.129) [Kibdelosporangium sp. MJ126-NF4]
MANRIHHTAIIGDGVELGDDNVVGPYSVIVGPARIGNGNWIGPHVSIGGPAEYLRGAHPVGWDGEVEGPGVVIGDGNKIREFVTVNQGVHEPTRLGDDCYLMGRAHVAHDCTIDDGVILTSAVQVAGHCHVWAGSNIGLGTVVHQRTTIGPGAMVGLGSAIRKEVGAFTITLGNPARTSGINVVGLQRRGCDDEAIAALQGFLTGKDPELPAGLPDEVAALLKAWADRAPQD